MAKSKVDALFWACRQETIVFSIGWFGVGILTEMRRKCFYKDSQAQIIGFRMFALARTCEIQRLRSPQLRYHISKADDGSTIQVMNDAIRLSMFLCAFNCEIGTCRAIF